MITLREVAQAVSGEIKGNDDTILTGIAGIKEAREGQITFVANKSFERFIDGCGASAIIVGRDVSLSNAQDKSFLIVKNPLLAYARTARFFQEEKGEVEGVSSQAFIGEDVKISEGATVFPWVYLDRGAVIEKGVTLYPFVHIGKGVKVGEGTTIYPNVTIYDNTVIGRDVTIHGGTVIGSDGYGYVWDGERHEKIPQLGTVVIEDEVEIGSNVSIDRASLGKTIIKKGTKIDNLVQVAHNVSIGQNSIIVSQVGIAGSTTIGNNVILAGQVGVKDHVVVGDNVRAGGGTGITGNVPDNSLISGTPHMPHREWLKLQSYLKNLPKLYRRMKRIEQKLDLEAIHDN